MGQRLVKLTGVSEMLFYCKTSFYPVIIKFNVLCELQDQDR